MNIEEIRRIQLSMLNEIHNFCKQNGIRYSLGYGTLLGAIRHSGYIPWDDDIDLIMPRPDYEKFLKHFTSNSCKAVSSISPNYYYPFAKIIHNNTRLIEFVQYNYPSMGIYIDLFPVDGIPSSINTARSHYRKQAIFFSFLMFKQYKVRSDRMILKNLVVIGARIILCWLPISSVIHCLEKGCHKYNYEDYSMSAVLIGDSKLNPIPPFAFNSLELVNFENLIVNAISCYDSYLTNEYGNYHELPPKEKQVSNHTFHAYFTNK